MSVLGGRGGRPDDWSTPHDRARARASEQLDGPLEADEARWLDEHLAGCPDCAAAAADYASQRLELHALRDRAPQPPRDLWARTAVAIEQEARHRSHAQRGGVRRPVLAPYALLAGALVVAVVVGTLTSQGGIVGPSGGGAPSGSAGIAAATDAASPGPTPLVVAHQEVDYLSRGGDGKFHLFTTKVSEVCPKEASTCATTEPSEEQTIGPLSSPETVFGSGDAPLVVLGTGANGASLFAVAKPEPVATPTETPTATSAAPTGDAGPSDAPPTPSESAAPTGASPSPPPASGEPSSPPPSQPGTVEIANGVEIVDTTAAYAPDGSAFAFTARPADGSHGPDIYLWTVGDEAATPITSDHRSVFGSWAGDMIVGSTVVPSANGQAEDPAAFTMTRDGDSSTPLPQTGLAWRPVVDPTAGSAVYWAGTIEPTQDDLGWKTVEGNLVLGRWSIGMDTSAGPSATPLSGDQSIERAETVIATGPLSDWDARWDETGTRLAVWIASADDPGVGTLSLFVVDPFDGRIDLADPPLDSVPALAGFSIAEGRLAWAAPPKGGKDSRVLILAWNEEGFGQVESAPGDFLLVR